MHSLLTTLIAAAFVLGFMILIHEWGHFIVAKSLGVTVKTFSLGFGKRLFGFERNGTDYRVSALPFGGYVKMAGDNPLEATTDDPGEFLNHPRWHRFLIAIAGPMVNIIFAIVALGCLYHFRYERPLEPIVGAIEQNSPAQQAGLKSGDRIVAVGSKRDPGWMDIFATVALNPNQPVDLTVEHDGQPEHIRFAPGIDPVDQTGTPGFEPAQPMLITEVKSGDPADQAGIRVGDTVTKVDGRPVYSLLSIKKALQASKGGPVQMELTRNSQPFTVTLHPKLMQLSGDKPSYAIGIGSNPFVTEKLPWAEAFSQSWDENKQNAKLILELVKKMLQRKVSIKAMSGPVGIVQMSGQAARAGLPTLLGFMCLISINLGVMNLFPIPILDGGVILLLAIEGLMRRDISLNLKERIYQASFVFLVLFAAIVVFNDIAKMR
jgi:regulator of sigma E protease